MLYNITSNVKVTNTHPDWSKKTRRQKPIVYSHSLAARDTIVSPLSQETAEHTNFIPPPPPTAVTSFV